MLADSDGSPESNWISYLDTVLEYYLGIDPHRLTDAQWAEKIAHLKDIREREAQRAAQEGAAFR